MNNTWNETIKPNIYYILNDTYLNTLGIKWNNLISVYRFEVGGGSLWEMPQNVYNYEIGIYQTGYEESMKIGLMYVSDYGYAASPEYWLTTMEWYSQAIDSNWIYINNLHQWTISKNTDNIEEAFYIQWNGDILTDDTVGGAEAVRPTFYLNSDVAYISGNGTQSDPFRID